MDIGIVGGAYESAVKPLSAQRCVNLFPEMAEAKARAQIFLRRTPGLILRASGFGPVRGMLPMNGVLYIVAGGSLYLVNSSFVATDLGNIAGTGRVSMAHNGVYLCVVNGTEGYTYNVSTATFAQITDADYVAADIVLFTNGYFLFRELDSNNWFRSDVNNPTSFNASQIQSMSIPGYSRTGIVVQGEVFLLGQEQSRVWVSSTNDFAFALLAGSEIDRGCIAAFSPATIDNTFYFLGDDRVVYRVDGYQPVRISHHGIEKALGALTLAQIEAAVGFSYTQDGHYFYCLQAGDKTWVYDATVSNQIGQAVWHERSSNSSNWRITSIVSVYGRTIGGDAAGNLWELSLTTYTEGSDPLTWVRATAPVWNEDRFVHCSKLSLVLKAGVGSLTDNPTVELRTSDDGGFTWNDPKSREMGLEGDYETRVIWRRLGRFKNRIFEFSGSDDSDVALIAGYMDG